MYLQLKKFPASNNQSHPPVVKSEKVEKHVSKSGKSEKSVPNFYIVSILKFLITLFKFFQAWYHPSTPYQVNINVKFHYGGGPISKIQRQRLVFKSLDGSL